MEEFIKGEDGYPWFSRGDADAFAALCADNIATILVLTSFLGTVLPQNIIWKKVLPGCGISLLFGNVYYSMLATRMSRKEGRTDVCAQPYGINTPRCVCFLLHYHHSRLQYVSGKWQVQR